MFREALGYPTRPPEGGRSIILGGLALVAVGISLGVASLDLPLAAVAILGLLPWIAVRGYYVRVIRTTISRDRPKPPRFDRFRTLFTDGLTAVGIAIAYLLPAVVVIAPLIAVQLLDTDLSALLAAASVPDGAISVLVPVIGLFAVVAFMYLIGALYVLPVAVARFAHSGEWRDALELRTVVDGAVTEDYVIAWGISFLLQLVFFPIGYLLRVLLVGFFLHFLVSVSVRYCYGQGVGAALDLDPVETPDTATADTDADDTSDPTPAVTRVDTAQWGVSPGQSSDPMGPDGTYSPDRSTADPTETRSDSTLTFDSTDDPTEDEDSATDPSER